MQYFQGVWDFFICLWGTYGAKIFTFFISSFRFSFNFLVTWRYISCVILLFAWPRRSDIAWIPIPFSNISDAWVCLNMWGVIHSFDLIWHLCCIMSDHGITLLYLRAHFCSPVSIIKPVLESLTAAQAATGKSSSARLYIRNARRTAWRSRVRV